MKTSALLMLRHDADGAVSKHTAQGFFDAARNTQPQQVAAVGSKAQEASKSRAPVRSCSVAALMLAFALLSNIDSTPKVCWSSMPLKFFRCSKWLLCSITTHDTYLIWHAAASAQALASSRSISKLRLVAGTSEAKRLAATGADSQQVGAKAAQRRLGGR